MSFKLNIHVLGQYFFEFFFVGELIENPLCLKGKKENWASETPVKYIAFLVLAYVPLKSRYRVYNVE